MAKRTRLARLKFASHPSHSAARFRGVLNNPAKRRFAATNFLSGPGTANLAEFANRNRSCSLPFEFVCLLTDTKQHTMGEEERAGSAEIKKMSDNIVEPSSPVFRDIWSQVFAGPGDHRVRRRACQRGRGFRTVLGHICAARQRASGRGGLRDCIRVSPGHCNPRFAIVWRATVVRCWAFFIPNRDIRSTSMLSQKSPS